MVAKRRRQPQTNSFSSLWKGRRFATTVSQRPVNGGRGEKRGVMRLVFTSWDTVGIAAGVAVGTGLLSIGIALLVLQRLRRARGSPEDRVPAFVRELDRRMRRHG